MAHILYKGKTLHSRDHIVWQVRLWDENNHPGEWTKSWFEMGLYEAELNGRRAGTYCLAPGCTDYRYSPGAVCQWLFDTVAGIGTDGENHFKIAPVSGGTLTCAEACYQSIYGKVESRGE